MVEEPEQVTPKELPESECCLPQGGAAAASAHPSQWHQLPSALVFAYSRSFGDTKLQADMSTFKARHCCSCGRRTPVAAAFLVPCCDVAQGPPIIVEVAAQPWELHWSPLAHQHTLALRVAAQCKVEGLVVDKLFLS